MPGLDGQLDLSISTHAPRTGSDGNEELFVLSPVLISTHAPRTGSDTDCVII